MKESEIQEKVILNLRRQKIQSGPVMVSMDAIDQVTVRVVEDMATRCASIICTRPVPVVVDQATEIWVPATWWDHLLMDLPRWLSRWFRRPVFTTYNAESHFPNDPWPGHEGTPATWRMVL